MLSSVRTGALALAFVVLALTHNNFQNQATTPTRSAQRFRYSPLNSFVTVAQAAEVNEETVSKRIVEEEENEFAADDKLKAEFEGGDSDDGVEVADDDDDEGEDAEDEDDTDNQEEEEEKDAVINPPEAEDSSASYEPPAADGAIFVEHFQAGLSSWVPTSAGDYNGEFAHGQGARPAINGDIGLIIPKKARKYGISSSFSGLEDMQGKDLVVQYEVKLEEDLSCGGAYVKLPLPGFDQKKFNGDTPYSVMFGPDKCGATQKVHVIFQSQDPSGKRHEHHLNNAPGLASSSDKRTHLYTLAVNSSGEFAVYVDMEEKVNGTLMEDLDPPVQPSEEIDDPEDKKPKDWVDSKKIPDPDAKKPDDWDESAPRMIDDLDAVKPEGWLDDEPTEIEDPEASKPEEWDDEEDGTWEAPKIPNPKCEKIGCGEWKRPKKANPDFKGKWKAPLIDNPDYIGEWKPKKIPNPDFYKVDKYGVLGIGGIGLELWTMDQGVVFDNMFIGSKLDDAMAYAEKTFTVKKDLELKKAAEAKAARDKAREASRHAKGDDEDMEIAEDYDETSDSVDDSTDITAPGTEEDDIKEEL